MTKNYQNVYFVLILSFISASFFTKSWSHRGHRIRGSSSIKVKKIYNLYNNERNSVRPFIVCLSENLKIIIQYSFVDLSSLLACFCWLFITATTTVLATLTRSSLPVRPSRRQEFIENSFKNQSKIDWRFFYLLCFRFHKGGSLKDLLSKSKPKQPYTKKYPHGGKSSDLIQKLNKFLIYKYMCEEINVQNSNSCPL